MRLARIQEFMKERGWKYDYNEVEGLGSIDFIYNGLSYHIWEFEEGGIGAESNINNTGRTEDYLGDYESTLMEKMKYWR